MRPQQRFCMITLLLGVLLWSTASWAGVSAVGVWRSTSGNVFTIPPSKTDFDIIVKTTDGRKLLGRGQWDKQWIGYRFFYWVEGYPNKYGVATFLPDTPDTLQVQYDGRTTFWQRMPRR